MLYLHFINEVEKLNNLLKIIEDTGGRFGDEPSSSKYQSSQCLNNQTSGDLVLCKCPKYRR